MGFVDLILNLPARLTNIAYTIIFKFKIALKKIKIFFVIVEFDFTCRDFLLLLFFSLLLLLLFGLSGKMSWVASMERERGEREAESPRSANISVLTTEKPPPPPLEEEEEREQEVDHLQ